MKRPVIKPNLKLGAEPKKVIALGVLVVVAVAVYFWNSSDSPPGSAPKPAASPATAAPVALQPLRPPARPARQNISRSGAGRNRGAAVQEFKPTLKPADPIDPAKVDPILKLDLLSRLKTVNVESTGRTLFDFSTAAPVQKLEVAAVKPILPSWRFIGPIDSKAVAERAAAAALAAPKPPPPPIPLKFYGFTNALRAGRKRAFFLEGEDIFVAGEGDVIKDRYRVVRIGVNSAVVEDISNKNQQTLPLVAEGVAS